MGLSIEDGTGKGYQASVDNENHLEVHGVIETIPYYLNKTHASLYSMVFNDGSAATAGTNDSLLYIKNSSDSTLVIFSFEMCSDTANFWYLKTGVTATATTGGNVTAVTPTNLNASSGNTAEGTFITDDGDTMLLTGGSEIARWYVTANLMYTVNLGGGVVLKKNDTIGLFKVTTGADTFLGHITFGYFND